MDLKTLNEAVKSGTALRTRNRLQPAGGPGDVVYPPTYADGSTRHQRRIDGESLSCVLLDSVTSQANRMELGLKATLSDDLSYMVVKVGGYELSCLEFPHRVCDAALRGCTLEGEPYLSSRVGRALMDHNIAELFGCSPASLLFGFWHSNRVSGVGMKIPRSISAEIVAVNALDAPHTASRIDPLPIGNESKVSRITNAEEVSTKGWDWKLDEKGKRPSESLLGNIPPSIEDDRGVTMDYAQHCATISLASLRNLRLGENALAAQTCLAALGLAGFTAAFGNGCWLRSRCDLAPEAPYKWELITGPDVQDLGEIKPEEAEKLAKDAIRAAKDAGLPWYGRVELEAGEDLEELVKQGLQQIGVD